MKGFCVVPLILLQLVLCVEVGILRWNNNEYLVIDYENCNGRPMCREYDSTVIPMEMIPDVIKSIGEALRKSGNNRDIFGDKYNIFRDSNDDIVQSMCFIRFCINVYWFRHIYIERRLDEKHKTFVIDNNPHKNPYSLFQFVFKEYSETYNSPHSVTTTDQFDYDVLYSIYRMFTYILIYVF